MMKIFVGCLKNLWKLDTKHVRLWCFFETKLGLDIFGVCIFEYMLVEAKSNTSQKFFLFFLHLICIYVLYAIFYPAK